MADLKPQFPLCVQCGTYHPELKPGEICPMAKTTNNNDRNETNQKENNQSVKIVNIANDSSDEIDKTLIQLKTIINAYIEAVGITDKRKVSNHLVASVVKSLASLN